MNPGAPWMSPVLPKIPIDGCSSAPRCRYLLNHALWLVPFICIYNIWKCILESKIRYTYYKYYTSNEHVWLSIHLVCKSMYIKLLEFLSPVFVRTRHRRLQRNLLRSLLRRKWAAGGVSLCVLSRRRCPFPIGWSIQRGFPIIYQNGLLFILSWVTDLDITSKYIYELHWGYDGVSWDIQCGTSEIAKV